MTGSRLVLAVDIGTSGVRCILFDEHAEHGMQARRAYPSHYPQPGWSEQDADEIVHAVMDALREIVGQIEPNNSLEAVVLGAQLYSILAVDPDGNPLTPSLTWGDMRGAATADMLRQNASPELAARTGCPTQALYPLSKIRWLKENAGLPSAARFVSIKDYVVFRLTDCWLADWSTASASGLLNICQRIWDDEALALANISSHALPELASPRQILRKWRHEVSSAIGIPPDLPLVLGAGDAPLANIGVGATHHGSVAINLGTSAAVRALVSQPEVDPEGRLWTYIADVDHYVIGGVIGSGGVVYEWLLKDLLFAVSEVSPDSLFSEADRLAQLSPPGADDLIFIPYFSGEQSPGWNPAAKGIVYGLTLRHGQAHIIRAMIEGLVFALLRVVRLIEKLHNAPISAGYVTGGLTASSLMLHTLANATGAPIVQPQSPESSARGAAILAWLALGAADSYTAFAQPETRLHPDPALHSLFQKRFDTFCALNQHIQTFKPQE